MRLNNLDRAILISKTIGIYEDIKYELNTLNTEELEAFCEGMKNAYIAVAGY